MEAINRMNAANGDLLQGLPVLLPFPEGQIMAAKLLGAAIQTRQYGRAYLFAGRSGIGKAMAAHWFAAQVLWQCRRPESRLGREGFIKQIESGAYPDLIKIEPGSGAGEGTGEGASTAAQIRLEQVLELRRRLQQAAIGERWMVVINRAECLNASSGNALLKLLEDQPNCTFTLVSSSPEQMLPTICSRAQKVPFVPLSDQQCRRIAAQYCPGLDRVPWLIQFAGGSPGEVIRTYQSLVSLSTEVRSALAQFRADMMPHSVLDALHKAELVGALPADVQRRLLLLLQFYLWNHMVAASLRQDAIALIEQTIGLIDHRVNARAAWELLLGQFALKHLSWSIDLPVPIEQEPAEADPVKEAPDSGVEDTPLSVLPSTDGREEKAEMAQIELF